MTQAECIEPDAIVTDSEGLRGGLPVLFRGSKLTDTLVAAAFDRNPGKRLKYKAFRELWREQHHRQP